MANPFFRIAGDKKKQKDPDPIPPQLARSAPEDSTITPEVETSLPIDMPEDEVVPEVSTGKLEPYVVVYLDGSFGPFQCSNCKNFQDPNACNVVEGEIDPNGLCHVFSPVDEERAEQNLASEPEEQEELVEEPEETEPIEG